MSVQNKSTHYATTTPLMTNMKLFNELKKNFKNTFYLHLR